MFCIFRGNEDLRKLTACSVLKMRIITEGLAKEYTSKGQSFFCILTISTSFFFFHQKIIVKVRQVKLQRSHKKTSTKTFLLSICASKASSQDSSHKTPVRRACRMALAGPPSQTLPVRCQRSWLWWDFVVNARRPNSSVPTAGAATCSTLGPGHDQAGELRTIWLHPAGRRYRKKIYISGLFRSFFTSFYSYKPICIGTFYLVSGLGTPVAVHLRACNARVKRKSGKCPALRCTQAPFPTTYKY